MCRRLVIPLVWDDEHAGTDVGAILLTSENYNKLGPDFEAALREFLASWCMADVGEIKVLPAELPPERCWCPEDRQDPSCPVHEVSGARR